MVAPAPPLSHRTAGNLLGKAILPGSTACLGLSLPLWRAAGPGCVRGMASFLWASPRHACQPTNRGRPQGDPWIAARSIQPPRGPCGSRVTPSTRTFKPPFLPSGAMPAVTTPSLNHCQPIPADPPATPDKPHQDVRLCAGNSTPERPTARDQSLTISHSSGNMSAATSAGSRRDGAPSTS